MAPVILEANIIYYYTGIGRLAGAGTARPIWWPEPHKSRLIDRPSPRMDEQYKTERRDLYFCFFLDKDLRTIKRERGQVATVHQAAIVFPEKKLLV